MKKRLLICLILSICCIISSIPASATTDDIVCIQHGPFVYWCRYLGYTYTVTHPYDANGNGSVDDEIENDVERCEYLTRAYETRKICEVCVYEVIVDSPHGHAQNSHTLCGAPNSEGCSQNH